MSEAYDACNKEWREAETAVLIKDRMRQWAEASNLWGIAHRKPKLVHVASGAPEGWREHDQRVNDTLDGLCDDCLYQNGRVHTLCERCRPSFVYRHTHITSTECWCAPVELIDGVWVHREVH